MYNDPMSDLAALERRYKALCTAEEVTAYQRGRVTYAQMAVHLEVKAILAQPPAKRLNDVNGAPAEEG